MRPFTLVALGLAALLLAGYLLLVDRHQRSTDEDEARRRRIVPGLVPQRVSQIRIEHPADPARAGKVLVREGDSWRIRSPVRARADRAAVDKLLSETEFLEHLRTLPADSDRKKLGLDPAALRLVLRQDRDEIRLDLGRVDAPGQGVYLGCGDRLAVVQRGFVDSVDLELSVLRDHRLVFLRADELELIQVRGPRSFTLRRVAGGYLVQAGGQRGVRAEPLSTGRLVGALVSLRATRFLEGRDPALPGGLLQVKMRGAGRETELALDLDGPCPGRTDERLVRVKEGSWARACLAAGDAELLRVSGAELQDRLLTRLAATDLARIEITRGAGQGPRSLNLSRDGGRWLMPGGKLADPSVVREWVEELAGLKGRVLPAGALAGGTPGGRGGPAVAGRITLQPERGASEVLTIGAAAFQGGGSREPAEKEPPCTVLRGPDRAVLQVPGRVLGLLVVDPLHFRDRELVALVSSFDILRLVHQGPRRTVEVVREAGGVQGSGEGSGWRVVRPAGGKVDTGLLDRVVSALAQLRAERFEAGDGAFRPQVVIHLEARARRGSKSGDRERVILELGQGAGEGCPGRMAGHPPFLLSEQDCRVLCASP